MRNKRHFTDGIVAAACALMAVLFLIACQQSQQPAANVTPSETKSETSQIFVIFEGPWAIAPDPRDAGMVVAIAPKTKGHRALGVIPANTTLDAGVYDLQLPAEKVTGSPTFDKGIVQTKIDPQKVQRALDARLERYVIRLPKPEAYLAETRFLSRVGPSYPPDASTEQDYVTSISLRYSATSKAGFSLAGTQDAGAAFKPLLLQLETPTIRFTINPAEIDAHDLCNTHSREAFRDLVRLIDVMLYVDFPRSPEDCHKKDPQLGHPARAALGTLPLGQNSEQLDTLPIQTAGIAKGLFPEDLSATMHAVLPRRIAALFFHAEACMAPIIVGGGG